MSFELINIDTTNTLATSETQEDALEEYAAVIADDPSNRDSYIVVEFDEEGEARGVVAGPRAAAEQFGIALA